MVQSVTCHECETAHDAEVDFEGGLYGYWCPEIGFVPIDPSDLTGIEPDLAKLTALLAAACNCKRRKATPVLGDTWRVGAIETPAGDLCIYLRPRMLDQSDVQDAHAALAREISSAFRLMLTATGRLSVLASETARLEDVVELDPDTGTIELLSDPRAIVDVPLNKSGGRPSPYREHLDPIIQSRAQSGRALSGVNEEARAIRREFRETFPNARVPSLSTVKRALGDFRAGS